jgi:hypothetical protein
VAIAPEASAIDTRAAALAALGRFDEAIADAGRARALALAARDTALTRDVTARLERYRHGRTFVQEPLPEPRPDH